jgi:hypothetical protein
LNIVYAGVGSRRLVCMRVAGVGQRLAEQRAVQAVDRRMTFCSTAPRRFRHTEPLMALHPKPYTSTQAGRRPSLR